MILSSRRFKEQQIFIYFVFVFIYFFGVEKRKEPKMLSESLFKLQDKW
jgi:hypothetical protein